MTPSEIAAFLAQNAIKATVVFTAAGAVVACCRHRAAAVHHAIWAVAMLVVLLMPLATLLSTGSTTPGLALRVDVSVDPTWRPLLLGNVEPEVTSPAQSAGSAPSRASGGIVAIGLALWLLGATVVLARLARDLIHARGFMRRARTIDAVRLGHASVRAAESDEVATPMTAGVFRPVILLPAGAFDRPDPHLWAAFEHERAHALRHDTLFYILGRVVVACHWINPLAWLTLAQLRRDAERACDDRALEAGIAPFDYANALLAAAASSIRGSHALPLGMAAVDDLEVRLTAILQAGARRGRCSKPVTASLAALGVIGVVLGGVAIYAAIPPKPMSTRAPKPLVPGNIVNVPTVETSRPRTPKPSNRATKRATNPRTQTSDADLARLLEQATRHVPAHSQDLVAERAKWALSQARDGQLVAPLIELLLSPNERDAAYAAWTLGLADRSRAFEPLLNAMKHPAWLVRAEAAAALSRWADPRAAAAMREAVTDDAWQVRLEVVSYFGALGGPDSREVLRKLRTDTHGGVRMEADAMLASAERGGR